MTVAVVLAAILTAVIGGIWIASLATFSSKTSPSSDRAPGPFTALIGSVKGTVRRSSLGRQSEVQVINADDSSAPSGTGQ